MPDFGADVALGGLSLALPAAPTAKFAELLANVLPLVPLARPQFAAGSAVVAQLPVRVKSGTDGPLIIEAKLARGAAAAQAIDARPPDLQPFTAPGGAVYTVALPTTLEPGSYRLVVETTLSREKASRELEFRVLPR